MNRKRNLERWADYGIALPAALLPLVRPIALLFLITLAGAVGYSVLLELEPLDALYQSVITLSTVGFHEEAPFDQYTKGFTIVLILLGVGTVFYLITMFAASVIDGDVRQTLEINVMMRDIHAMKGHFVICGFGRVGEEIAHALAGRKKDFVILDRDPQAVERARAHGYPAREGDVTDDECLRDVGIHEAARLIASTGSDEANTYTVLTAKNINPSLIIVSRAESGRAQDKLVLAGADRIVSPYAIGGRRMALAALQPMMTDFMDVLATGRMGQTMISEFAVDPGSALDGKTLAEAFAGGKSTVLGIQKANGEIVVGPRGSTLLDAGDLVIVLADDEALQKISS